MAAWFSNQQDVGHYSTCNDDDLNLSVILRVFLVRLQACGGNVERAADWLFNHTDDLDAAVEAVLKPGETAAQAAGEWLRGWEGYIICMQL